VHTSMWRSKVKSQRMYISTVKQNHTFLIFHFLLMLDAYWLAKVKHVGCFTLNLTSIPKRLTNGFFHLQLGL